MKKTSLSNILRLILMTLFLSACGGGENNSPTTPPIPAPTPTPTPSPEPQPTGLSLLHTDGVKWVNAADETVILKGTNLGNWLLQSVIKIMAQ